MFVIFQSTFPCLLIGRLPSANSPTIFILSPLYDDRYKPAQSFFSLLLPNGKPPIFADSFSAIENFKLPFVSAAIDFRLTPLPPMVRLLIFSIVAGLIKLFTFKASKTALAVGIPFTDPRSLLPKR